MSPFADPVRGLGHFVDALRTAGLRADHGRLSTAVQALAEVGLTSPGIAYWALRIALCSSPADVAVFDTVFTSWLGPMPIVTDAPPDTVVDGRRAGASIDRDGRRRVRRRLGRTAPARPNGCAQAAFDDLTEAQRRR